MEHMDYPGLLGHRHDQLGDMADGVRHPSSGPKLARGHPHHGGRQLLRRRAAGPQRCRRRETPCPLFRLCD